MIRAVIFDMYETLVTLMPEPRCFSREMASIAGVELQRFREAWRFTEEERMTGLPVEDALEAALKSCGAWSEETFGEICRRRAVSRKIGPDRMHAQIIPMLEALRARGLAIGLTTNCQLDEAFNIRRSALWKYFDVPMLSCDTGLVKPHPSVFLRCAALLEARPEECLYVGDGGSDELTAARALGMRALQAVWYRPRGSSQPLGPVAGFPQLNKPMEVLNFLD